MNNKKKSVIALILVVIFAGIVAFTTLVGFGGDKHAGSAKNIKLGLDLKGGVSITYDVIEEKFTEEEFNDTKAKLEKRVYNFSTEAEVYKEGEDRIVVDIPGETDADKVLDELGKPGALQFVTYTGEEDDKKTEEDESIKIWLEGSDIASASGETQTNEKGGIEHVVSLKMTDDGAEKFYNATSANVGSAIYIVYDGKVVSSPVVENAISGGQAVINGMDSIEEANNLASTIRIGSLKLELDAISHKVVGAKLGQDALDLSIKAGIIGFIIICIFMILVYRVAGVVADLALAIYVGMIMVTLNAFDITLTLSGIAGIILSVGMAVDANVIIFARVREEIGQGVSVQSAIKLGFEKATSAIVDGNVTTIIAAVVLMWKGSGTVQGFAQTLAIGIVLSMFTALVISRILIFAFYELGCKNAVLYGQEKVKKTIDFISKKNLCFAISLAVVVAGAIFIGMNVNKGEGAFNYSIEFQGGKSYAVDFDKEYSIDEFNDDIKPKIAEVIEDDDIQGQKEKDSTKYTIKFKDVDEELVNNMKDMLVADFGADKDSFEETFISASVSKEMSKDAVVASAIAIVFMLIYIWFRFSDIKFATSAVLALIHDIIIVVVFYAITRTAVGTTFIACVLTILGYSINATIVIFDRIRENLLEKIRKETLKEVVNKSVTQTLTRSIYTSLTTFIAIFMIYIMGVPSIKDFAFPLMAGIICGAYSSVCITGALWYTFASKFGVKKED